MTVDNQIDLVIYLSTDWKSYSTAARGYFGDVPFIKALSKLPGVRILCVNQPFTPLETSVKKRAKAARWLGGHTLEKLECNLFLYTPFAFIHEMLAVYRPALQGLNRMILGLQLRRQLKELGYDSPMRVSWIYHPLQYTYYGLVGERFRIYKSWDLYRIRDYSNRLKRAIVYYEKLILREASAVLTPCINLYRELSLQNINTFFTPSGVDFEQFGEKSGNDLPIPDDLRGIRPPRIGFSGNINEKVDMSLIRYLAESHPEWSMVMLGNIYGGRAFLESKDYRICRELSNVHFLGFREFETLPSYIKHFDVCLLAHSRIESMKYAHPYKTLQYLAAGKPVVATDIPDAHYYEAVIKIARDNLEFVNLVRQSLEETGGDQDQKRIEFAKNNTWDKRAEETYEILQDLTGF